MASTSWSPARPSTNRRESGTRRSPTPTISRCWRSPCRRSSRPGRPSDRMRVMVLLLALVLGASAAGAAEPVPTPKMIFFATGSTRGTAGGHVLRGARDLYSVKASGALIMTVTIAAPDDNAVCQLYEPGTQIGRDADGLLQFT